MYIIVKLNLLFLDNSETASATAGGANREHQLCSIPAFLVSLDKPSPIN